MIFRAFLHIYLIEYVQVSFFSIDFYTEIYNFLLLVKMKHYNNNNNNNNNTAVILLLKIHNNFVKQCQN